jgi:hypothetical protein
MFICYKSISWKLKMKKTFSIMSTCTLSDLGIQFLDHTVRLIKIQGKSEQWFKIKHRVVWFTAKVM